MERALTLLPFQVVWSAHAVGGHTIASDTRRRGIKNIVKSNAFGKRVCGEREGSPTTRNDSFSQK